MCIDSPPHFMNGKIGRGMRQKKTDQLLHSSMMEDGLKYHQINTNFDLCILSPYIFLSDIAVGYLTSTATKWLVNAGDASSLTAETDGPYAWDYCFKEEQDADPEEMYYGRGPIQLTG